MTKLAGKVAVITGGSSGIGLATARKFAEEGAHVFITGRRQEELDKAAKSIGKNVTTVQGDVAKLDDLDRLYETVRTEKGAIDIVVATAGFVESAVLMDATPEHFDKTFDVNARDVLHRTEGPAVAPRRRLGGPPLLLRPRAGRPVLVGLLREQGGDALVRPHLGGRPEGPGDTGQHGQPRPDRYPSL